MNIFVAKAGRFGPILTSRPEGREAALLLLSNELRNFSGKIEVEFTGVSVLTPSWLGEFVETLKAKHPQIEFMPSKNKSVQETVSFLQEINQI